MSQINLPSLPHPNPLCHSNPNSPYPPSTSSPPVTPSSSSPFFLPPFSLFLSVAAIHFLSPPTRLLTKMAPGDKNNGA